METNINSSTNEVFEDAIEKLKASQPELSSQIDDMKEYLKKAAAFIMDAWNKIKEFVIKAFAPISSYYVNKIQPLMKYYAYTEKKAKYKNTIHKFLGTESYQKHASYQQSNIYYNSGKSSKRYKRSRK